MQMVASALLLAVLAAGCAQQVPITKPTQSGKAEVTFRNITIDRAKDEISLVCAKTGAEIRVEAYSVSCGKRDDGTKAAMAQVLLGNRFSETPWQWVRFTIVPAGHDVFVTAESWLEMSMGFGETKRIPNTNHADLNQMQAGLDAAADRWASGHANDSPPAAQPTKPRCDACERIGGQ